MLWFSWCFGGVRLVGDELRLVSTVIGLVSRLTCPSHAFRPPRMVPIRWNLVVSGSDP